MIDYVNTKNHYAIFNHIGKYVGVAYFKGKYFILLADKNNKEEELKEYILKKIVIGRDNLYFVSNVFFNKNEIENNDKYNNNIENFKKTHNTYCIIN